eukprot:4316665-Pleurochrysis_carterae.AAC.1
MPYVASAVVPAEWPKATNFCVAQPTLRLSLGSMIALTSPCCALRSTNRVPFRQMAGRRLWPQHKVRSRGHPHPKETMPTQAGSDAHSMNCQIAALNSREVRITVYSPFRSHSGTLNSKSFPNAGISPPNRQAERAPTEKERKPPPSDGSVAQSYACARLSASAYVRLCMCSFVCVHV